MQDENNIDAEDGLNSESLSNIEETTSEIKSVVEDSTVDYYDASKSLKENLEVFFTKYRKSKLKHVPKLVSEFKGKEAEVMAYLNYKYVTKVNALVKGEPVPSFGSKRKVSELDSSLDFMDDQLNDTPKKSKKGLIIGIIAVLVLALVGWFFVKPMLSGDHKEDAVHEEVENNVETTVEEPEIKVEDIEEHLESANTAEDSAAMIERMLGE